MKTVAYIIIIMISLIVAIPTLIIMIAIEQALHWKDAIKEHFK